MPPNFPARQLPVALQDLALVDWHGGLSCRAIAEKHHVPGGHKVVARFLTGRGIDVQSRPAKRKVNGVMLGATVTNHQAYMRRRPPLRVPVRIPAERLVQSWTPGELEAIAYEIRCRAVHRHAPWPVGIAGAIEGRGEPRALARDKGEAARGGQGGVNTSTRAARSLAEADGSRR
jgi:hypothetical protein